MADLWAEFDQQQTKAAKPKADDLWAEFDGLAPRPAIPNAPLGQVTDLEPVVSRPDFSNVQSTVSTVPAPAKEPSLLDRAANFVSSSPQAAVVRGLSRAGLGDAFQLGDVSTVASAWHTITDTLDQLAQKPMRDLSEAVGARDYRGINPFADPLGLKEQADSSLDVVRQVRADQQAGAQEIGGRPSLDDFLANPSAAIEQATAYYSNQGVQSVPAILLALASRNPEVGGLIMGGTTGSQTFADLRADGIDRRTAGMAGAASGLIEASLGRTGLEAATAPGVRALLTGPLVEAGTEAVTALGQSDVEDFARGKQTPFLDKLSEAFDSAVLGAGFGVGEKAASSAFDLADSRQPAAAPRPSVQPTPQPDPTNLGDASTAPEDTSDLDALLTRNLPPEVVEAARAALGDPAEAPTTPAPVLDTARIAEVLGNLLEPAPSPASPAVEPPSLAAAQTSPVQPDTPPTRDAAEPDARPAPAESRGRQRVAPSAPTPTPEQSGQVPAGQSAPVPAGTDLGDAAIPRETPAPVERRADAIEVGRLNELRALRKRGALAPEQMNELLDLSDRDRLTGKVAGRRMRGVLNMEARVELEDAGRLKPVQAFADADNFKAVNDRLGHEVGDHVIRQMGELFAEELGEGNVFHRGGDEFVMQGDSPEQVNAAMEAVRQRLAGATFRVTLDNGEIVEQQGVRFSYGAGRNIKEAENAQRTDKEARKRAGLRTDRDERRTADAIGSDRAPGARGEEAGQGRVDPAPAQEVSRPRGNPADLRAEIGWAERGGRIIRGEPGPGSFLGDVIGRTPWVGLTAPDGTESTFWRNRPIKWKEAEAKTALDKFERGEALTSREQGFIDYAQKTADDYEVVRQEMADDLAAYDAAERARAIQDLRDQHAINVAEADRSEALGLYELVRRAVEAGHPVESLDQPTNETNQAYAARLWNLIKESTRGADTRATQADPRGGDQGRASRPIGTAEAPGDFALQPEAATETRAAPQQVSGGLFGAPTARDFIDARQRQRDDERNGKTGTGRTDIAAGDGELFAGPRPEQARVDEPLESLQEPQDLTAADLTDDERAVFDRARIDRAGIRTRLSQEQGEADADALGLRDAVRAVLGDAQVTYLRGMDGLPEGLRAGAQMRLAQRGGKGRAAGLYDKASGRVYLFTDVVTAPDRAAFTAAHEVAGHRGLRALLGTNLDSALEIALQNPTVAKVADAIGKQRNTKNRLLAAEEALAELAAAVRTGDFATIKRRYGVDVSGTMQSKLRAAIDNFLRRLANLFRKAGAGFTDAQVRQLLENAWQAAKGETAIGEPEALESVEGESDNLASMNDQTNTPAFRRWFGDSKVVDANGEPLVVYHGTAGAFDAFNGPAWFAKNRELAGQFTGGGRTAKASSDGRIVDAYLSVKNPLDIEHSIGSRLTARELLRFTGSEQDVTGIDNPDTYAPAWRLLDDPAVIAKLQVLGYDGVSAIEGSSPTWLAFRPEQIKSATANRGTFDPDSASILESVEDYTPEQQEFMRKAGIPTGRRSTLQRIGDKMRDEWSKVRDALRDRDALKQAIADNLHGLRAAEGRLGLENPETSPYIAARMTRGLPAVMEGLMLYGAPKWDRGALSIAPDTKGLLDALKPVEGKLERWLGWMVARRAHVLKQQGRERLMTNEDISAGLALAGEDLQAFKQAARDYLTIKNHVLDVAQEAGLIDPEARAAWDHAEYIPFYRAENEGAIGPGTRRGLAGQTSGIRTLKGGEQSLADPLANIVRNFTRLLDAAGKNRATLLAVDQLGDTVFTKAAREMQPAVIPLDQVKRHLREQGVTDEALDAMPTSALKGVQRMLSIVPPSGEDVVRVMRNGKAEYYHVADPLVLRALTAFKTPHKSLGVQALTFFKRLLTTGVTTTADFIGANFLRDSGSAWVISDDRFKPGWDSVKGVVNTLRNDEATREMMMAGSTFMGGNFYNGDPDAAAAALRRALRKKGLKDRDLEGFLGTIARSPLQVWDAYLRLSSAVENANRRAVYDAALASGRTKLEAAYMARDLMDFSMQGDSAMIQFLSDALPFFNARIQGLYKLGRRAGTPEGRKAILLRGGAIMLASAALYAWNVAMHGDAWDELEEWDKDAYWHIAPGTEHHIRIPKPFEIGIAFSTIPERMMEAMRFAMTGEGDTPSASWDALVRAITGTLAINPIPQAALPIVEQWANKRFFTDRAIESMADEKLLPEARAEWYTSDTAKQVAKLLPERGPAALSPKRLEHLWTGYTGGMGAYLLDASDWITRQLSGAPERPEMALRDFPVLGRFARGDTPGGSKYVGQFYDLLSRAEEVEGTIKEAAVLGDTERAEELERKHADLLGEKIPSKRAKGGFLFANVKELRKVRAALSDLRERTERVALSDAESPAQKRLAIDFFTEERNRLVRDAVRRRGTFGKLPDRTLPDELEQSASEAADRKAARKAAHRAKSPDE